MVLYREGEGLKGGSKGKQGIMRSYHNEEIAK
jgi:hypothetical protein